MTEFQYRLLEQKKLTQGHLRLLLTPQNLAMAHRAGQYLNILYPNNEWFPFSIANAPQKNNEIELHIRLSPNDLPLQNFLTMLKKTNRIVIKGPIGQSIYQPGNKTLILIAAGTGFAASKAIIEAMSTQDQTRSCFLYWSVKKTTDFYLPQLPDLWQTQLPNFHYAPIVTQEAATKKNNVIESVMSEFSDFSNCIVHVFGPPALAITTLKIFNQHGLARSDFYSDVIAKEV